MRKERELVSPLASPEDGGCGRRLPISMRLAMYI